MYEDHAAVERCPGEWRVFLKGLTSGEGFEQWCAFSVLKLSQDKIWCGVLRIIRLFVLFYLGEQDVGRAGFVL